MGIRMTSPPKVAIGRKLKGGSPTVVLTPVNKTLPRDEIIFTAHVHRHCSPAMTTR